MRKALAAFLTALLLTFGGGSVASAQGPTLPADQAEAEDEGFDTGLVGLLGLLGLLGLRKRKRSTRPRAASR